MEGVRRIDVATRVVTKLAGGRNQNRGYADGEGTNAKFAQCMGVGVDSAGAVAIVVSATLHTRA
jgi:hypothetical protein